MSEAPPAVPTPAASPVPAPAPPAAVTGEGRRFQLHAFVCVSESACERDGPAMEIRNLLKGKLRAAGLKEELRINQAGCLGQCGHGPMMVVYPEGVWYSHLTLADAERIWDEHIVGGRPVEELRFRTQEKGTNVIPFASAVDRTPNTASPYYSRCSRCPSA
ncbi:MAG: (2Fe-2S) ferredoxin domain-containing protein [Thermoplasmatota archaeon]